MDLLLQQVCAERRRVPNWSRPARAGTAPRWSRRAEARLHGVLGERWSTRRSKPSFRSTAWRPPFCSRPRFSDLPGRSGQS